MQTAASLAIVVLLCLITPGAAAPAEPEAAATIEQCAKLLPQGRRYTFSVEGTIDVTGATPVVHGELSLSDDSKDDLSQLATPFAQCFARFVR